MRRVVLVLVAVLAAVVLAACGDDDGGGIAGSPRTGEAGSFAAIQRAARGQSVRWWMFGGDDRVNDYVDDIVAPAARRAGITVERVPISDTADAVQRVVAERRAGKTDGGGVDLVWINGENFASGKEADLWLKDWAMMLPNARYLDPRDPTITTDFQVPVDGQEAPWTRAAFVYAHDAAEVARPPRTFDELLAYAHEHPGRFTYPAPPDFTGSAFVRQVVAAKGEEAAFTYLNRLRPFLHERGRSYPKSEAELNRLFADGQVDFAMSYEYGFVRNEVRKGSFAETTRPFLLEGGALQNVAFVTIPANAANRAGAQVLANLLLSPELQARKADPEVLGGPTVLDVQRVPGARREQLAAASAGRYVLEDLGAPLEEFAADRVAPLEARWRREVLPR